MKAVRLVLAATSAATSLTLGVTGAESATERSESLKVGLVTQAASLGDRSAGHLIYLGVRRAAKELDVTARVLTPGPKEGFAPSLAYLGRQRFELVIAGFLEDPRVVDSMAQKFPRTMFVMPDIPHELLPHRPNNVRNLLFREEQIGYLVGYLASRMEQRRPGRDVVSAVGGASIPQVDHFLAGFRAGARKGNQRTTVLIDYANDFLDPRKCRAVALSQIARGSGAVFQVAAACGFGALAAARSKGVWGIGVDTDQSYLGSHILTSAVKREDVAVFETIRSFRNGTLTRGGNSYFTLANGGLGLGRISPKVPAAIVAEVERVRQRIVAGTIRNIPTTVR